MTTALPVAPQDRSTPAPLLPEDGDGTSGMRIATSADVYATVAHQDILLARQETLEEESLAQGAARFRKKLEAAAKKEQMTQAPGGERALLATRVKKLEDALRVLCNPPKNMRGRRHASIKWVKLVGPDVAAYLTLKVVLDSMMKPAPIARVCRMITNTLLTELRARRLRKEDPQMFAYQMRSAVSGNYAHMAKAMSGLAAKSKEVDISDLQVSHQHSVIIGAKLLDLLMETTQVVELMATKDPDIVGKVMRRHHRPKLMIVPTAETSTWIQEYGELAELWHPVAMPMVVPPLRWAPGSIGGYRFGLKERYRLIKTQATGLKAITAGPRGMPMIYDAVNALQHTAWKVNGRVLDVMEELLRSGGDIAGLPSTQKFEMPPKPDDIDTNAEARKLWRKEARKTYTRNVLRRQEVLGVLKTLSVARTFSQEDAFYFPYSLDFRGRMYPLPVYFQPQGDDMQRGLLTFADGKLVDGKGAEWLAVHGANCMKDDPFTGEALSKMSLTQRQHWTLSRTDDILSVADSPLSTTGFWTKADKPFAFLAFCFEWAGLYRAKLNGESYSCSLPCAMDGTCNGLQHLSAMLADEIGGRSVNLVPSSLPADVYSDVAEKVLREVISRVGGDEPDVDAWWVLHSKANVLTRKLTKRPTMTYCYGATPYGFRGFVNDFLVEFKDKRMLKRTFGEERGSIGRAAGVMGDILWSALSSVVQKASEGMSWLQCVAEGIARVKGGTGQIHWTVPVTGFTVTQHYTRMRKQQIRTVIAGQVRYPKIYLPTAKTNTKKQANAIAPNVVHSLDAAALAITIHRAAAAGIDSFMMIHDSYGTVPADCELMAQSCRMAFTQLYRDNDVTGLLYEQFAAQWDACPAPPEKGMLDVSQVMASEYFFS